MTTRWSVLALAALAATAGCRNACQDICVQMANYAEECGFNVSDAELDACLDEQSSDLEKTDKEACRDFGSPELIRNEWSCNDLEAYWGGGDGEE